jgi:hypothetical protein
MPTSRKPNSSDRHIEQIYKAEANRPVGPGAGKHRGDRRDMNKAYTGNRRTRANHTNPKSGRGHSTGK